VKKIDRLILNRSIGFRIKQRKLYDVDFSAVKLDLAFVERENRIISANACVFTREEFCAALTQDDTACLDNFTGVQLNAPVFGVTVSAVSC
jgi:hypothetical protein